MQQRKTHFIYLFNLILLFTKIYFLENPLYHGEYLFVFIYIFLYCKELLHVRYAQWNFHLRCVKHNSLETVFGASTE